MRLSEELAEEEVGSEMMKLLCQSFNNVCGLYLFIYIIIHKYEIK